MTMLILLKSIARNLILPPAGPLLIAFLGLLLVRRRRPLGVSLIAVGTVSLWLLSTDIVADALTHLAERYPPLELSKAAGAQAVVILGGGGVHFASEYGGWVPDGTTLDRVMYGAYVARHTSLPVLISGSAPEAVAMKITLSRNLGVETRWVEGNSGDTFENAAFSARILLPAGIHRIILVTSGTQEWRAAHEFMAAGLEVIPAPTNVGVTHAHGVPGYLPSPGALTRSYSGLYELLGEPVREIMSALHIRKQHPAG